MTQVHNNARKRPPPANPLRAKRRGGRHHTVFDIAPFAVVKDASTLWADFRRRRLRPSGSVLDNGAQGRGGRLCVGGPTLRSADAIVASLSRVEEEQGMLDATVAFGRTSQRCWSDD
jgi:hypothetical protein